MPPQHSGGGSSKAGSTIHLSRTAPSQAARTLVPTSAYSRPIPSFWCFSARALSLVALAGIRVVVEVDGAAALRFDILRLRSVVLATFLGLVREDGNVVPRRRVPVRVVVSLLRTETQTHMGIACFAPSHVTWNHQLRSSGHSRPWR